MLLNLLSYVCRVFNKYRCSFKLNKCDFLQSRCEYVGIDIAKNDNSPVSSKYQIILDWGVPRTRESLGSFIGLMIFYNNVFPWQKVNLITL